MVAYTDERPSSRRAERLSSRLRDSEACKSRDSSATSPQARRCERERRETTKRRMSQGTAEAPRPLSRGSGRTSSAAACASRSSDSLHGAAGALEQYSGRGKAERGGFRQLSSGARSHASEGASSAWMHSCAVQLHRGAVGLRV